ncbi:UNVERIFIED_CONTAM: hypothetical protein K2H54_004099 [Gekko kuhli]
MVTTTSSIVTGYTKRLSDFIVAEIDEGNTTCYSPAFMHGLRMLGDGPEQLHYKCYIHFDDQDYLFLGLIGFCIFSAGTVLAWLFGVCAVIYEFLTTSDEDEEYVEDETAQ